MGVGSGGPGEFCHARARSILHPTKAPRSLHSGGMAQAQTQKGTGHGSLGEPHNSQPWTGSAREGVNSWRSCQHPLFGARTRTAPGLWAELD